MTTRRKAEKAGVEFAYAVMERIVQEEKKVGDYKACFWTSFWAEMIGAMIGTFGFDASKSMRQMLEVATDEVEPEIKRAEAKERGLLQ